MIDELATQALRKGSPDILSAGLQQLLIDRESEWLEDGEALVVAMAPLHDCAGRLGLDLRTFFAAAAKAGPESLAAIVREFGRRKVKPDQFNFEVEETWDGPRYLIRETVEDPTAEARMVALDLAMQGNLRPEAEVRLLEDFDPEVTGVVLDELFGPAAA